MGRPIPDLDDAVQDREQTLRTIESITREAFGAQTTVRHVALERLDRRLLRYTVDLESRAPWLVIGKIYASAAEAEHAFQAMQQLSRGGFSDRPPAGVRIPGAYACLPDLRLVLMEHVPGEVLRTLVKRKAAGAGEMQSFAAALIKLQRSPLIDGEPRLLDHHLAVRCAGLHEALAGAFPDLRDRVQWIVATARELQMRGDARLTLVHGDFHLGQIHVNGREAWILDLDPLHVGDPGYDLAMVFMMLKHLEQRTGDGGYIRSLRDVFLSAYLPDGGYDIAARVPLHMALIHLKRACKRFRWQDEPGWPDTIRQQIAQGAACMETAVRGAALQSVADVVDLYDRCPATS